MSDLATPVGDVGDLLYDFHNFQSLSTMMKPVTLACGHSGCQDCLPMLVATATLPDCPLCNEVISSGTPLKVNIVLHSITAKLEIQCTNTGCEWKGKYEDHVQHSNMCDKLPLTCENAGCGETIMREEMAIHISHCQKQEILCQDCGKGVARDLMGNHVDSLCSHKRISCPLSCGIDLPRYVFAYVVYVKLMNWRGEERRREGALSMAKKQPFTHFF